MSSFILVHEQRSNPIDLVTALQGAGNFQETGRGLIYIYIPKEEKTSDLSDTGAHPGSSVLLPGSMLGDTPIGSGNGLPRIGTKHES